MAGTYSQRLILCTFMIFLLSSFEEVISVTETDLNPTHHWMSLKKSMVEKVNSVCVSGVDALTQGHIFPSHFIVASSEHQQKNGYPMLCSNSSFMHYNETTGAFSKDNPLAPVGLWDSFHFNISAVSSSSDGSHGFHINNESPYHFEMRGGKKDQQATPGSSDKSYSVSNGDLKATSYRTLPWIADYVATFFLNATTGDVEQQHIGAIKAAMLYNNYDGTEANRDVASTASYSLLQPVTPSMISFYMMEANIRRSPSQSRKQQQRKLLQKESEVDASSHGYTIDSTTACPNGYCFKLPKKWLPPSCTTKNKAYPNCLYKCVCG